MSHRKPRRARRFAVVFSVCFPFGFAILLVPPVQTLDVQFSRMLVRCSQALISVCGGKAILDGAILRSPDGFAVEMRDGCNAVEVTILLWAAVVAFPATWRLKLAGLIGGSFVIQVVNIFRFISLFYLGQYSVRWFEFAHSYLWESLILLDTIVIFWLWVNRVTHAANIPHAGA